MDNRQTVRFPKWKVEVGDLCKMKFNMINFINIPFSRAWVSVWCIWCAHQSKNHNNSFDSAYSRENRHRIPKMNNWVIALCKCFIRVTLLLSIHASVNINAVIDDNTDYMTNFRRHIFPKKLNLPSICSPTYKFTRCIFVARVDGN